MSSLEILSQFIREDITGTNKTIDISQILTSECYLAWLNSRKQAPKNPVHAFRKVVTGHCMYLKLLLYF